MHTDDDQIRFVIQSDIECDDNIILLVFHFDLKCPHWVFMVGLMEYICSGWLQSPTIILWADMASKTLLLQNKGA